MKKSTKATTTTIASTRPTHSAGPPDIPLARLRSVGLIGSDLIALKETTPEYEDD
jgi:hypothetical protein